MIKKKTIVDICKFLWLVCLEWNNLLKAIKKINNPYKKCKATAFGKLIAVECAFSFKDSLVYKMKIMCISIVSYNLFCISSQGTPLKH